MAAAVPARGGELEGEEEVLRDRLGGEPTWLGSGLGLGLGLGLGVSLRERRKSFVIDSVGNQPMAASGAARTAKLVPQQTWLGLGSGIRWEFGSGSK